MNIILLTRNNYQHCYVANKLAAAYTLSAIVVDRGKPKSMFARVRTLLQRYTLCQLLSRLVSKATSTLCRVKKHERIEMFRVLGRENCERHLYKDIIKYVNGLNTVAGFETIKALDPDVILVFGTAVVSDKILSLAHKVAINMHTGISPYYRGAGCTFWPLYNEELHMLGATIHECTSKIDGGMIYEIGRVTLELNDNLSTVFARCVKLGTELYTKVIGELLAGELHGTQQQFEIGYEYKAAMKGWWQERTVRRKIKKGLIKDYVTRQSSTESDEGSESGCLRT